MTEAQWWWRFCRMPLAAVIVSYLALALLAPMLTASMLYYPQLGSRRAPSGLQKIRAPDGTPLAILHLPNPGAKFTLWFFHGNAEDLGDLEPLLHELHGAGFAVLAFDYPGYGLSEGRPSEAALYAAARAVRDHLRHELNVPAERTLIYGRSLGSGPAVQMAMEEKVGGLVIQSGFMSVNRVVTRWPILPFDQFKNLGKLPRVTCPVLVMHGRSDEVIAFAHGEALFRAAPGPKQSLWVEGAGHNDLIAVAGPKYWQALREFAGLCDANLSPR